MYTQDSAQSFYDAIVTALAVALPRRRSHRPPEVSHDIFTGQARDAEAANLVKPSRHLYGRRQTPVWHHHVDTS